MANPLSRVPDQAHGKAQNPHVQGGLQNTRRTAYLCVTQIRKLMDDSIRVSIPGLLRWIIDAPEN